MNIKDLAMRVPRPYRKWYARALLVVAGPFVVIIQGVVDAAKWCWEIRGELVDYWREAAAW